MSSHRRLKNKIAWKIWAALQRPPRDQPAPKKFDPTIRDPATLLEIVLCGTGFVSKQNVDSNDRPLASDVERIVNTHCDSIFTDESGSGTIAQRGVKIRTCTTDPALISPAGLRDTESLAVFMACYTESGGEIEVPTVDLGAWAQREYVRKTIQNGTLAMSVARMASMSEKILGRPGATCVLSGSSTGEFCPEEIAFLEAAPFPLYRVVNMAALFPELREKLYTSYGVIIGMMMAREFFFNYYEQASNYVTSKAGAQNPNQRAVNESLNKQINTISEGIDSALNDMAENIRRSQVITAQITGLERQLRDTIFSRHILGNQAFSFDVSSTNFQPTP